MTFTVALTSALSGASTRQLHYWRKTELLVPEVNSTGRPILYSFRDVIALRTVIKLREQLPLGKIRRAFAALPDLDLTEHPSRYALMQEGSTIAVVHAETKVDLVNQPGQVFIASVADIAAPFNTETGTVVDLRQPRRHLAVREQRLGGWPTIEGTRVPYDVIAELLSDGSVTADEVGHYYPEVSSAAALDALDFARSLSDWHEPRAA